MNLSTRYSDLSKYAKIGIIGSIIAFVLLLFVAYPLASLSSTKSQGVDKETQLTAQYRDNQNTLSAYIAGFYEQTGVAKVKSDKLNAILLDAVKGRYEGKMSPGTGGAFFSAITEAYPDLSALNIYDKIVDYVSAGREGYKNKQTLLLDRIRDYDNWRNKGLFHPGWVKLAGFPSTNLEAGPDVTGSAALVKMKQIVLTSQARKAYETGEDQILTIPNP